MRELWDDLQIVESTADLTFLKKKPKISERLSDFRDEEVLEAIREVKRGKADEKPVKQVELEALLAVPEGFGDDVPVDPNFHARRLPERVWRHSDRWEGIEAVIQLHRLREVLALVGFTRLEAVTPDINGEYETDVERAQIALDPRGSPLWRTGARGCFFSFAPQQLRIGSNGPPSSIVSIASRWGTRFGCGTAKPRAPFRAVPTCYCIRSRTS